MEWGGHGGIEQKGKRTHGHGQQCSDCCAVCRRVEEDMGGEMVMDRDSTGGSEHTIQCADDVLRNRASESCRIC